MQSKYQLATASVTLLLSLITTTTVVNGQSTFPATPLVDKRFSYPTGIPYQVDTDPDLIRGRQTGYNICNSTTQNQDSLCQTSFLNSVDDWCLWGPPIPDQEVGSTEGESVAWCVKPGHGTRLIPAGAIKGLQFTRTPDYVQVVGFIDQTLVNIKAGDFGGETDPHGADLRGNPLGGIMFSNAFSGNADTYEQVVEWHNFMGGDAFCFKACDAKRPNAAKYCEHIYDRIGCAYNAPNAVANGTFTSCDGDSQDFPGVYTDASGAVQTYRQPPESDGVISTLPYDPKVPASSNCVTHTSSVLFSALATVLPTNAPTTSGGTGPSGGSTSRTGTGSNGSPSSTGTNAPNSGMRRAVSGEGWMQLVAVVVTGVVGVVGSAVLLS